MNYFIIIYGLIIGFLLNKIIYILLKKDELLLKEYDIKDFYKRVLLIILNSIMYYGLINRYEDKFTLGLFMIISSTLLIISFIDYKTQIIPDECNMVIFLMGIIYFLYSDLSINSIVDSLVGLLIGGGLFLLIALITNAMGGGDIKLMGVLGFLMGIKYILLISLLSFVIGAIISIILLILQIKRRKDPIAFGPFICISTFLVIFYGEKIIQIYFEMLNIV